MTTPPNPPDAPKPKNTRGGRRKGAGAPKGNLNALKHGRRSRQVTKLAAALATVPETHDALIALARHHDAGRADAKQIAHLYLQRILEHAEAVARGEKRRSDFTDLIADLIGDLER
ncbi:MAG TPA: hypothetical protein VMR52_09050 [Dehalococcoidia bacterium]|nr:hypothetical protein [Dehalococcoidia bacterium]